MAEHDTDYTDEVVCPWCGYEHKDSWEISFDAAEMVKSFDCEKCEKEFEIVRDFEVHYSTSKPKVASAGGE